MTTLQLGLLLVVTTTLLTLPGTQAATREVCHRGCSYSTISSALLAANSGDVVHIRNGAYTNEPLNIDVYSDITIKTDGHVTVSPRSDAGAKQLVWWLGIMSHVTLEGDMSFVITPAGFLAPPGGPFLGVVQVYPNGSFVQQGNLQFSFKGPHPCTAISVHGYWNQSGLLGVTGTSQSALFVSGLWYLDANAKVAVYLLGPRGFGVFLLGATVSQYGDIVIHAKNQATGLYYEGYHGMKGWKQYGNLNLKVSDHSQALALEESIWSIYGNVTINMDDTSYPLGCSRSPEVNVFGHFDVRAGSECYTLPDQQGCRIQKTPCLHKP